MKVYTHVVTDQLAHKPRYFGISTDEDGTGYQKAMKWINQHQEYRGGERYEYFGTDEEIDFQWDMSDEQYDTLKSPPEGWTANDYLGAVFFGNCKLEFILANDEYTGIYCNMFVLGQEGYAELPDGTPYSEYEGFACKFDSNLPKRRTFEAFAKHIEQDIVDVLNEYNQLIDEALKPTNPEKWYPGYKYDYMQKITRRA